MMKSLLLVPLVLALCAAVPTQLSYTLGVNYVYNVSGIVQNNGYDTNVQDYVPGYYSYMQAYMVMQPIKEDDTSYLFVMNLFGTVVSVSNVSGSGSGPEPNGNSLGDNMYFTQLKTGPITQIQYYVNDPIYYVNVKLGAINAFQTSLVSVGAPQVVLECDPVGNHSATITAVASTDGSLTLTKVFNQVDFSAFPDPTVTAENMNINAQAVTAVHAEGYIMSSNLNQAAIMTNGAPSESKRSMTNSTGFDVNLSALGTLSVQYTPNSALQATTFNPQVNGQYVKSTMFEFATSAALYAKTNAFTIENPLEILLSKESVPLPVLTKVGNHYRFNAMDELASVLVDSAVLADATIRDRLFYVLTVTKNEEFLVKFGIASEDCEVVNRAVLAAAQFVPRSATIEQALAHVEKQTECAFAQKLATSVLGKSQPRVISSSEFPFNKSYNGSHTFGGKTVSIDFQADLFAGTNLNCQNSPFNYEAQAAASATITLFGSSQQAFDAQIIYGQENGSPLADAITLTIWGNPVYNHDLPVVPCEQGSYPLAHITPGWTVDHTLWVSIIPIIFSASVALDLTATWGWTVCPSQLTADVDISGDGAIAVTGSTYTDLLLLRAGFDLSGSFQTNIVPTVSISGDSCSATFEVDVDDQPMTASLTSYYEWRHCKILFFDCKWENYNTQNWWEWASAAKDYVLFKYTYQIIGN